MEETSCWKETYVSSKPLVQIGNKDTALSQGLSQFLLNRELKGRNCAVKSFKREGRICYVAYPEDYTLAEVADDSANMLRKKHPHKPVFSIYFTYDPSDGRLVTKAKGGWQRVKEYQQIFAQAVLGQQEELIYDRIFDLDKLKDPNFTFPTPPEDNVEYVKVKSLQIKYFDGTTRTTIESTDSIPGIAAIHNRISQYHVSLASVHVSQAAILVKFRPTIKRSRGTVTVRLTYPNSHDLANKPLHLKVKQYLKTWKMDTRIDHETNT